MIAARSLTKTYGPTVAVAGVDFTVEAGRVTGFRGHNGAGKSTTMRMIQGLDHPTAGSVVVGQRLGIAAALLGDPATVLLDEPVKRARPRGHPVDPRPAAPAGRRGPYDWLAGAEADESPGSFVAWGMMIAQIPALVLGDRDGRVVQPLLLDPWTGFAVCCAQTAVPLAVGMLRFVRRDA